MIQGKIKKYLNMNVMMIKLFERKVGSFSLLEN